MGNLADGSGGRASALRVTSAVLCACIAAALAGCGPRQVATAPSDGPALVVPVIPPRVYAPLPEAPATEPEVTTPEEPSPAPARPVRQRPRPDRPAETRPADATRPEPAPGESAPPASAPTTPATPLRTPQIADDTETGRRIRATIGRAVSELTKVKTATLSGDARMQYETARRFVDQAEGALNARNYMFAAYLADKAEALARGLAGR